ncbi:Methionine synthase B12-binding module cap domain protein [Gemmatirosa kalamazoonensis]|uniref:Methionine synthase B12-binding module cap domain protein n=1 Tax=Gemmatirosa kalamazoonensis TaxID=861299 RepID=W0RE55_9BACT|nr:MerR family transcriptional regulator [Gemmatirosa kalamazoonensis]AHG89379.1 Methionine synthase B12-binding module cap domain protein [Gemmatirosa kalamazoonensis]
MPTPSEPADHAEPRYPIRVAARRAGLTTATVRAWERRYRAVAPARTETDRRLYSEADIERLRLLRALAAAGRSLTDLSRVPTTRLRALVEGLAEPRAARTPRTARAAAARGREPAVLGALLRACDAAVRDMDAPKLQTLLGRALVGLPPRPFFERVVVPLLRRVGRLWERGEITVAHEHAAAVAVRQVLGWMLETFRAANESRGAAWSDTAPALVAATPQGERHELGALMVAVLAAAAGWRVSYLGADLPAADIAAAARKASARVVALSVVVPGAGDAIEPELRALRAALDDEVALLVGGAEAPGHAGLLAALGAARVERLRGVGPWLAEHAARPSARSA